MKTLEKTTSKLALATLILAVPTLVQAAPPLFARASQRAREVHAARPVRTAGTSVTRRGNTVVVESSDRKVIRRPGRTVVFEKPAHRRVARGKAYRKAQRKVRREAKREAKREARRQAEREALRKARLEARLEAQRRARRRRARRHAGRRVVVRPTPPVVVNRHPRRPVVVEQPRCETTLPAPVVVETTTASTPARGSNVERAKVHTRNTILGIGLANELLNRSGRGRKDVRHVGLGLLALNELFR